MPPTSTVTVALLGGLASCGGDTPQAVVPPPPPAPPFTPSVFIGSAGRTDEGQGGRIVAYDDDAASIRRVRDYPQSAIPGVFRIHEGRLYVGVVDEPAGSEQGGEIEVLDLETGQVVGRVTVPPEDRWARDIVFLGDGRAYLTTAEPRLRIVDLGTLTIVGSVDLPAGATHGHAGPTAVWSFLPDRDEIVGVDPLTDAVVRTIAVPDADCPNGGRMVEAPVGEIDIFCQGRFTPLVSQNGAIVSYDVETGVPRGRLEFDGEKVGGPLTPGSSSPAQGVFEVENTGEILFTLGPTSVGRFDPVANELIERIELGKAAAVREERSEHQPIELGVLDGEPYVSQSGRLEAIER